MKRRSRRPPRRRLSQSDGFNLVVLAALVTALNIMVAAALPAWAKIIERQKEEELIFRGMQYAEAIRVFQLRQNRFPNNPNELIEVIPRSIRQLWKNPLVEDGAWLLLPATGNLQPPGRPPGGGRRPGGGLQPTGNGRGPGGALQAQPTALRWVPPERPGEVSFNPQVGQPFMGVASPDGETGAKTFLGSQEIGQWQFTVDLAKAMLQTPTQNFPRPLNAGNFWKPFPPGVTLPGVGGPPSQPPNKPPTKK